ncbi:MAG: penicillin acylase family protein, partial [Sphaerospermopsis sp. SIO1G1]|nr:penicillin acylase family protein [Sphaerospermopsis sp. SIO1G1]
SATDPTATPKGLSDPEAAVKALKDAVQAVSAAHGSLDVAWGDVYRLRQGERDLPASGGFDQLGAFDVLSFAPEGDGTYRAVGGTAYRSLTEFGPKLRAEAIMPYGNTLDQNSPYYGTQLALYASRKLRPVLFYRDDVLDGSVEQVRLTRPAHASKK